MGETTALYKNLRQTVLLLFFVVSVARSQISCASNCDTCDNSGSCLVCDSGYYEYGFYPVTCRQCGNNCDKCTSSSCSTCKSGYGIDSVFSFSGDCVACPKGCTRCSKSSIFTFSSSDRSFTCTECASGYTYSSDDGGKCLSKSQRIGGIIGGIIGAVVFVVIIVAIIYCCCKKPATITRTTVITSGPSNMYQTGPQPMNMGGPQPGYQPGYQPGPQQMVMGGPAPYNAPQPAPYAPTGPSPWGPQPTNPAPPFGGPQPSSLPPGFLDQKGPAPQF